MKIQVDENIPRITVEWLREQGHDVRDFRGTPVQGLDDPDLWTATAADARMLITTDRGFSSYRAADHCGILIVRLRQPNRMKIHHAIMLALQRFSPSVWPGMLVVMRDRMLSVSRRGGAVEPG